MAADAATTRALSEHAPEPANLWIDAALRRVGRSDASWIDLRTGDLGGLETSPPGPRRRSSTPPRLVYVPPEVVESEGPSAALAEARSRTLIQVVAGRRHPAATGDEVLVFDLLEIVLQGDLERLAELPPKSTLLWPLVPGLTDSLDLIESGLSKLVEVDPVSVTPVVVELSSSAKRALSERLDEAAFARLFHASAKPRTRGFARTCVDKGLEFLPSRTGVDDSFELRVSAELGLIADLWGETRGSEVGAQRFYQGARWLDSTTHDLRALLRDGNLGVVPWMDSEIGSLVAELASGAERSGLLAQLMRAYTAHP